MCIITRFFLFSIYGVSGTETVTLHNLEVSWYKRRAGALTVHYYLSGTDDDGNRIRVEISKDDYTRLSYKREVTIEYYEHTDRIVNYR